MVEPPTELDQFLAPYDEAPRALALGLRAIVVRELAPCHEYIFAMRTKIVLLYGASERVIADGICSIGIFRRHVTLTFVEGVDLPDPRQLLRGAGKTMRHLRIGSAGDLGSRDVRVFLRQARALARMPRQDADAQVSTRVKPPSAVRPTARLTFRPSRART